MDQKSDKLVHVFQSLDAFGMLEENWKKIMESDEAFDIILWHTCKVTAGFSLLLL